MLFWQTVLKKCQSKFLQCSSGHCIPQRYLCDGRQDCPEGSDEETGRCGMCIHFQRRDCFLNEYLFLRIPFSTGRDVCGGKIRCADGRCIPKSLCCYPNEDAACKATYVLPCCMQFLRHRLHAKIRHNLAVHSKLFFPDIRTLFNWLFEDMYIFHLQITLPTRR